jgi:hypothetical protein
MARRTDAQTASGSGEGDGLRFAPAFLRFVLLFLSVGPCVYPSAVAAQSPPPNKLTASLQRIFGAGCAVDSVMVDGETVLRVRRDTTEAGFALVRNVKGKDQPITFLVATDLENHLKDVDILVYREAYGGEVAYDSWRRQFRGKGVTDSVEVGRDIRGISGATISVNAVTLGVRRAVADLTAWHEAGKLQ